MISSNGTPFSRIPKMDAFIHDIPKAELHLHIEGTLEPELMFEIAAKNGLPLPFESIAEARQAYHFTDLQSFLDIYYRGVEVLREEADFYRMTGAYLRKASEQNVRHAEIFFDPQIHTARGIKFEIVIDGIHRALVEAEQQFGLTSKLIMCFLRHLSLSAALATLRQALVFKDWITAVGLDSTELGFPPEKFKPAFDLARQSGFKTVAHAGEEGPADYIWQAIKQLGVERIDHGIRCVEDPGLVAYLVQNQVPLTVCPLSNVKLRIFDHMHHHNLMQMLNSGLCVTVNSDDPAYFGGYIEENFIALHQACRISFGDVYRLCRNAFRASFLDPAEKNRYLDELDGFVTRFEEAYCETIR
jgi:adenosine deaminase